MSNWNWYINFYLRYWQDHSNTYLGRLLWWLNCRARRALREEPGWEATGSTSGAQQDLRPAQGQDPAGLEQKELNTKGI